MEILKMLYFYSYSVIFTQDVVAIYCPLSIYVMRAIVSEKSMP